MRLNGLGTSRRKEKIEVKHIQLAKVRSRIDKKKLVSFSCRCQYSCNSRVSLAERKRVFKEFYKISNHDDQNKYLLGLIQRSSPKRKKKLALNPVDIYNFYDYKHFH